MVKTSQDVEKSKKTLPKKSAPVSPKPSKTAKSESKAQLKVEEELKTKAGATSKAEKKMKAPTKEKAKPKSEKNAIIKSTPKSTTSTKKNILEESNVQVKNEIIVEVVSGTEPKLEAISILQTPLTTAPVYSLNEESQAKALQISFHKIVPQDDIIHSLNKANYKQTSEDMQKILQAVLRGSDVFANMSENNQSFLIGTIGSTYKTLSGGLTRVEAKQPLALILTQDEKKCHELYTQCLKIFSKVGVQFAFLDSKLSDEEKKSLLEKHMDVLFSTVQSLENANENLGLNLDSIGLCFVYELQNVAQQNASSLTTILKRLPQERVQKVFIANENTPKAREIAFSYLDDLEYFYMLPSYVQDRSPKQFAHALTTTQKFQVLLGHLKHHKPVCAAVFTNTRSVAEWIAYKLHGNGIKVELITSNLNYTRKQSLLKSIKAGEVNVIVTTDLQATNLGIENLNCLYQFDLPDTPEKFIDRLNLIEKSKFPISVSFICEDYGYNMGKIEEKLGFKIHVNQPDKDYFNIKDTSDYPLEADGRVKKIGQVYAAPVAQTTQTPVAQATQTTQTPVAPRPTATPIPAQGEKPVHSSQQPRLQPRPASSEMQTGSFTPRPHFENRSSNKFDAKPQQGKFENKYQDKYIRRDDKAKEAIEAARLAAQEKRNGSGASAKRNKTAPKNNILSIAVYIVQDAIKAASEAAKHSLAENIEQNMPLFANMLSKVPFLKKKKD